LDTPDFDLEVKTRSGERMWVNVSTLVFEEPRRNRHLVVHLARDISHRKKSEELLAKMREISKDVVAVADHNTRVPPCEHNGCSWACDKRIIVILPQKPESIEKEANR